VHVIIYSTPNSASPHGPAADIDHHTGIATGYVLSLNLARRPWLARIVLRLLWRPASRRYARRSSTHTDSEPLRSPRACGRDVLSSEVKRSAASHERDNHRERSAVQYACVVIFARRGGLLQVGCRSETTNCN